MPVTLKQLAARAHVHPSTISRVANHDPGQRIAPVTRQRIEELLRETEYRPNGVARGLKLRQTLVLAVVIPDITNPFFAALFRGVEDGASPRGYNVLLCNTDGSPERQRPHLQSLHARQEGGARAAKQLLSLDDRPTAIFAVTDMTAVGAFGAARRMGLRIPQDVAIVGYNDIPLASRMVPALTTVHVPIHDFGSAAARLLLEQVETGEPSRQRVIFNPELIVRGSTAAGAGDEPRLPTTIGAKPR